MEFKQLNKTTFEQWKSDRATIEIGDVKQPDFYPQIKTKHWGNECNLSLRLVDDGKGKHKEKDGVVTYTNGPKEVRFYNVHTDDEDGGFEFDIRFDERPESNVINFTIQHKGFECYKQEPLTEEQLKRGAYRPEHIIGSYMFYHESKKNNEYKTGKAFQIPRPWAIDSNGWQVWCDQNIDGENYSITMPPEFVSNAALPILIDPTFGYTSIGASTDHFDDHVDCCEFTPAGAGTVVDFNVYSQKDFGGIATMRMALYTKVSSQPSAVICNTTTNSTVTGTAAWSTGSSLTGTLTFSAVPMYIGVINSDPGTCKLFYDSGGTNQFRSSGSTVSYPTFTNPITTLTTSVNAILSMYINYTSSTTNTTDFFNMF